MTEHWDSGWKALDKSPYLFRILAKKAGPNEPLFDLKGRSLKPGQVVEALSLNLIYPNEFQFKRLDGSAPSSGDVRDLQDIWSRAIDYLGNRSIAREVKGEWKIENELVRLIVESWGISGF